MPGRTMPERQNPAQALIELARGFEKLASAIETEGEGKVRPIPDYTPDYGSLGTATYAGTNPLTQWLLS